MSLKRGLGAVLFLVGVVLLISEQSGITGSVVGERFGGVGSFIAIVLILGGLLIMQTETLESRLKKVDPDVYYPLKRKIKKELRKKGHRNITEKELNIEALNKYEKIHPKYLKSVASGIIEKSDPYRPLAVIEDFVEKLKLERIQGKSSFLDTYFENKKKIRGLFKEYHAKRIDDVEFANGLNDIGELTGGVYKPQDKLSANIEGHPYSLSPMKSNDGVALEIHRRILLNDKSYKKDCEFNYSKKASTKHHTEGLEGIEPKDKDKDEKD